MATVAVQVTQQPSNSSLPADAFVNVLHFDGGTDYQSIGHAVLMAYNGTPITSAPAYTFGSMMTKIEVRVYDLADPKPRPERYYESVSPSGDQITLPNLLCAVLSFYAGRNLNGLRGRAFIGPMRSQDIQGNQIDPQAQQIVLNLGQGLYETDGGTWNHVVYSTKKAAPTPTITNYFVSSLYGVQHSRSLAQMSRATWSPPSS